MRHGYRFPSAALVLSGRGGQRKAPDSDRQPAKGDQRHGTAGINKGQQFPFWNLIKILKLGTKGERQQARKPHKQRAKRQQDRKYISRGYSPLQA